jgi:hypothetical protein
MFAAEHLIPFASPFACTYLTEGVHQAVLQKSTPLKHRQRIFRDGNIKDSWRICAVVDFCKTT